MHIDTHERAHGLLHTHVRSLICSVKIVYAHTARRRLIEHTQARRATCVHAVHMHTIRCTHALRFAYKLRTSRRTITDCVCTHMCETSACDHEHAFHSFPTISGTAFCTDHNFTTSTEPTATHRVDNEVRITCTIDIRNIHIGVI